MSLIKKWGVLKACFLLERRRTTITTYNAYNDVIDFKMAALMALICVKSISKTGKLTALDGTSPYCLF